MRKFKPKTEGQQRYIDTIINNKITFCLGVCGTGKTACAVRFGIEELLAKKYEKMVLTRPCVSVHEDLGALPGLASEKLGPYVIPMYDELMVYLKKSELEKMIKENIIEICPIAHLRGRTFNNSYIVVDEANNLTPHQMKALITRFGKNSKMVISGDPTQSDLKCKANALIAYANALEDVEDVGVVYLHAEDIVREQILKDILEALMAAGL